MYPSVSFPLQDELQFARSKDTDDTSTAPPVDFSYGENVDNIVQQLEPQH